MLLALYLVAIYLAKLWVGAFLGRILLKPAAARSAIGCCDCCWA
jgi:hypothetical protein